MQNTVDTDIFSDDLAYLQAAARLLGLPLPQDRAERVLMHFQRTQGIAATLLAFPLPDRIDPAGEFEP